MNNTGLSAALAMALTAASVHASDAPKEVITTTRRTTEAVLTPETLDLSGIQTVLLIGSVFLGAGLSEYSNRDSSKKDAKIAKHVFRILGEDKNNRA